MNKLFKYFTLDDHKVLAYISWFTKSFPESEFSNIEKVLYLFLEYCAFLNIPAKRDHLLVFVATDLKSIVRKYNIRADSITVNYNYDEIAAFEQAVKVISANVVDTYDAWCSAHVENLDDFKVKASEFMKINLQNRIMSIFTEEFTKMNQGGDIVDIAAETQYLMASVREIYDTEKLNKLDFLTNVEVKNGVKIARLIAKTGLAAIDEDYGGIFSKALITFAGQTGIGKTRFLISTFVYPALVNYKVGVRMDELELSDYEIENMLITIHIAKLYGLKIPDKNINRNDLNDEERRIVESARIDLFESGKYGRFKLSTEDLFVETLMEEMLTFYKLNPDIQIWCLDYVGLVQSKPKNKYEHLTLGELINKVLVYAKKIAKMTDTASICANQFNDEGNKAAAMGKPIGSGMIHGGQAVQRHSDYDLALTATDEQKVAGMRFLSTTKDRASVGFKFQPLSVDLSILRFTQVSVIEERG